MAKNSPLKIKFVGGKRGEHAPAFLTDGTTRIDLPADQSKPFSHSSAAQILKACPELYKPVKPKKRKVYRSAESGKFVRAQTAIDNPATTVSDTF